MKTSTKRSAPSSSALSVEPGVRSLASDWGEIDPDLFQIYLAVPGSEPDQLETDVRFMEHVYTISEEDLSDDPPIISTTSSRSRSQEVRECQSQCVQTSCLPVSDIASFTDCVSACKAGC